MKTSARNRFDIDSFIVCFYCNKTFASLSILLNHCCSPGAKLSLDSEPLETIETADVDLSLDWESREASLNAEGIDHDARPESVPKNESQTPGKIVEAEQDLLDDDNLLLGAESTVACQDVTNVDREGEGSDALKKQFPEINANIEMEETDVVESNTTESQLCDADFGETSHLGGLSSERVSNALQYFENGAKQNDSDGCCISAFTEIEFQSTEISSTLLSLKVQSDSHRHGDAPMECNVSNISNKTPMETESVMNGRMQNKSNIFDQMSSNSNAICVESRAFGISSEPLSPERDSSNYDDTLIESDSSYMFGGSAPCEMELDSMEQDHQAELDNTSSLSEKQSQTTRHDAQFELHSSEITSKSFPVGNSDLRKRCSVIVKPCYVKLHDIFKSLPNPKINQQKVFKLKKKYHTCDVCYKIFRFKSDLSTHYHTHTCEKPYVCSICNKAFTKQSSLFAHHLAHAIQRRHVCSVCNKAFAKKSLLLRHNTTHTNERPYSCEKCDKSFPVKSTLMEHYFTHSNERPFVCEICNFSFTNRRYLRKHYDIHKKNKELKYTCDLCYKKFQRKFHLDEHYNIHTGVKPYECKICDRSFHLSVNFNYHYSVEHKNERAFIFQKCEKGSKYRKIERVPVIQRLVTNPIVQKIQKLSEVSESEETRPHRKLSSPKKYLQSD